MTLRLYDTAARAVRDFEPLHEGKVGIYHCGLTVQAAPHIGHIRKEVVFDVLRRWLERSGYEVTIIANVTDIDDKILAKSAEAGHPWWAHAYANERALNAAYDALGCIPPTYEPRATGHIPEMVELIDHPRRERARLPGRRRLRRRVLRRALLAVVRRALGPADRRHGACRGRRPARQARPARLRAVEGPQARRARDRVVAVAVGSRPAGLAPRVLGDGGQVPGRRVRHPRRRPRPALPAPRERAGPVARGRAAVRPVVDAQRDAQPRRREDEQVAGQHDARVSEVVQQVRPVELRYYLVSAHYRSVMEFSFEALHEAASAYRRIEGYVRRATEIVGDVSGGLLCADFAEAMDDDLAVPAALAALQGVIREGNKLVLDGPSDALRGNLAAVRAMLDVLGLDPRSAPWTSAGGSSDLLPVVDQLVSVALNERAEARTRKDFAAADRIRDRLTAAGIAVEDTPDGPRWTLAEES